MIISLGVSTYFYPNFCFSFFIHLASIPFPPELCKLRAASTLQFVVNSQLKNTTLHIQAPPLHNRDCSQKRRISKKKPIPLQQRRVRYFSILILSFLSSPPLLFIFQQKPYLAPHPVFKEKDIYSLWCRVLINTEHRKNVSEQTQFVMLDNLVPKSLSMPIHLKLLLSQEEAVLPTWETVAQLQL